VLDNTAIIQKIRKLLALSNSCNEHEAALAAVHVQRLLSEHNLAMADIEAPDRPERADSIETAVAHKLPRWLRHLTAGVSAAFDCQAIHHPAGGRLTFIGIGADAQVAVYTFIYLERTIRKLCSAYLKVQAAGMTVPRQRELLRQSYCLGAASTVTGRLTEQKRQTPVTPGALVPVKEALIRRAMKEIGPVRTLHSRRSYIDSDAYAQGLSDGRQVSIHKGVAQGRTAHSLSLTTL
jgi:hypothetical protein